MLGDARRASVGRVAFTRNGEQVRTRAEGQRGPTTEVAPIHTLFVVPSGANGSPGPVRIAMTTRLVERSVRSRS
jgi:hypothetical protein